MKTSQEPGNDEQLRTVLRQWAVETPLPPRFQEGVWQRIQRAELRPEPGLWAGLLQLIEVRLPRPKVAFSYVAALVVLGVAAGSVTAQIRSSQTNTILSERYVQLVDPYHAGPAQP